MKNLFEYSDILHSPIEAFTCATENVHLPVEAHWHYFMEVIYLQEGSVLVTCNDACKRVEAGSVMFFPPQAVHAIYADGGKRFRYFCIKFNMNRIRLTGSYLPDLNLAFRRVGALPCPPILFTPKDLPGVDLGGFFEDVEREYREKQYAYDASIYSSFASLMLRILRIWHCQGISLDLEASSETEENRIQDILVYIDRHSQENINIEELAHHYNMSYSYFAKMFLKYYGQSCKQYIEFIRLNKVENFLLFTDYDLNYIAAETGFADCSHLIRTFKKHYQITPKQFRLRSRKIGNGLVPEETRVAGN